MFSEKKEHISEKNTFASAVFRKAQHYISSPTHLHIFSIRARILLLCTWPAFLHVKKKITCVKNFLLVGDKKMILMFLKLLLVMQVAASNAVVDSIFLGTLSVIH